MLIFLEDMSLIEEKAQQAKLAALGRLSASIAHEIRNPVGAMSHAGQLLAESEQLSPQDKRLTEIIRGNADRVSTIINNVLQLSRREATRPERLSLQEWLDEFRAEFCETMQLPRKPADARRCPANPRSARRSQPASPDCLESVRQRHPSRLRGQRHGDHRRARRPHATAARGRSSRSADRGPGVSQDGRRAHFRAFLHQRQGGTGLGLFLARELAQTNGASLLYENRAGGGSRLPPGIRRSHAAGSYDDGIDFDRAS